MLLPVVSRFIVAVGGCCDLSDCSAAREAAVLGSAWLIADVGGCWPVVAEPGAPAVGPVPASCAAMIFDIFSISLAH
jgi:hypothetical protein